jgi:hypothetical protein
MSSFNDAKKTNVPTDRELRPTCSWCGSHVSKDWLFILVSGKFYCSFECRDAAYYRIYIGSSLLCLFGLIVSMSAYISIDYPQVRELGLYLSLMCLIGTAGGLYLTRNSRLARNKIQKNARIISSP